MRLARPASSCCPSACGGTALTRRDGTTYDFHAGFPNGAMLRAGTERGTLKRPLEWRSSGSLEDLIEMVETEAVWDVRD